MLSPTVMCGKSPICWITYPIPRRSSVTGSSVTSRPSIRISPESNGISRLTILSAVVLPPPDGPTRTQNVPEGISSDRSSTAAASRPAYRFVTWSKTISAADDIRDPHEPDHSARRHEPGGDPHREAEARQVEGVVGSRHRRADDG